MLLLLTEQEALEKDFQNVAQASRDTVQVTTVCPMSLMLSIDLIKADYLVV